MNKNKLVLKAIGFLLVGIMIALIFTAIPSTYSWFNKKYNTSVQGAQAISTKDILEEAQINYKGDVPSLKLKKSEKVDYSPIIFFDVEGDIKNYVIHMDSVKLTDEQDVPITTNVNLSQAISLILSPAKEISGTIRVKHLNGFIDEPIRIKLSKWYLLEGYFADRGQENYGKEYLSSREKDELLKLVKETLNYSGKYLDWESIIREENREKIDDLNTEVENNKKLTLENKSLLEEIKILKEKNTQLIQEIIQLKNKVDELSNKLNQELEIEPTPQAKPAPGSEEDLDTEPMPELEQEE